LRIEVMNELTAPAAVDVPIFVYINCKDVEFANPRDINAEAELMLSVPQSDLEVSDEVQHEDIPVVDKVDHSYEVYMGERVLSLRQLTHRAVYWDTIRPSYVGSTLNNATFNILTANWRNIFVKWIIPRFPLGFATYADNGSGGSAGNLMTWSRWTDNATFDRYGISAKTTPTALITACYAGWRGSMVWRGFLEAPNTAFNSGIHVDEMYFERDSLPYDYFRPASLTGVSAPANAYANVTRGGAVVNVVDGGAAPSTAGPWYYLVNTALGSVYTAVKTKFSGVSRACPDNQPFVEATFPHQSTLRMLPSNPIAYQQIVRNNFSEASSEGSDSFTVNARYSTDRTTTPSSVFSLLNTPAIDLYAHAGVDYSAFMFVAVPTLWRYTTTSANTVPAVTRSVGIVY